MKSIFRPMMSIIAVSFLAGSVYAADDNRPIDQNAPGASQTNPGTSQSNPGNSQTNPGNSQSNPGNSQSNPGTAQSTPGTNQSNDSAMTPNEREYQAAVKRCESQTGTEQKKCVDAAKKKFGQM